MSVDFAALLDVDTEMSKVPPRLRRFLKPANATRWSGGWWALAVGYHDAFRLLAERAAAAPETSDGLVPPMLLLCRHTVELNLKGAIQQCHFAGLGDDAPASHDLDRLWRQLLAALSQGGWSVEEPWSRHCSKIVNQLHAVDPDGQAFRYPVRPDGTATPSLRVMLDDLIKAEWHLDMYCSAVSAMLEDAHQGLQD